MLSRPIYRFWVILSAIAICGLSSALSGYAQISSNENDPFCRDRVKIARQGLAGRFVTSKPNYRPSETAVFRIDNVGRISIGLIGEDFSLQRFVDGNWRIAPESPHAFSKIRLGILAPGKSGFCRVFPISSDIAPGHYRFRKIVTVRSTHKHKQLTASFHISTD